MTKVFFLFALMSSVLVGCGKNTNYLYHDSPPSSETFVGTFNVKDRDTVNKVDILWIIDNSGSMGSHQQAVANNVSLFLTEFAKRSDIDWKMGLISTDISNPPFVGFTTPLTGKDPNAMTTFQKAVQSLGTNGDATERSFDPALKALGGSQTFLRDDAYLVLFIITDAGEQSGGKTNGMPAQDFFSKLVALKKGQAEKIKVYMGYGGPDLLTASGQKCDSEGDKYQGSEYENIVTIAKGSTFAICSADFGNQLAQVANGIVRLLSYPKIYLSARPRTSTIRIDYKGKILPGGEKEKGGMWFYDYYENSIVFYDLSFAPGDIELVNVDFVEDNGWHQ